LNRFEFQNIQNIVDAEVHIIKLGSIAIATNPFELYLDYGNQIKARSRAEQTFVVQLSCGAESYLPTKKQRTVDTTAHLFQAVLLAMRAGICL